MGKFSRSQGNIDKNDGIPGRKFSMAVSHFCMFAEHGHRPLCSESFFMGACIS